MSEMVERVARVLLEAVDRGNTEDALRWDEAHEDVRGECRPRPWSTRLSLRRTRRPSPKRSSPPVRSGGYGA